MASSVVEIPEMDNPDESDIMVLDHMSLESISSIDGMPLEPSIIRIGLSQTAEPRSENNGHTPAHTATTNEVQNRTQQSRPRLQMPLSTPDMSSMLGLIEDPCKEMCETEEDIYCGQSSVHHTDNTIEAGRGEHDHTTDVAELAIQENTVKNNDDSREGIAKSPVTQNSVSVTTSSIGMQTELPEPQLQIDNVGERLFTCDFEVKLFHDKIVLMLYEICNPNRQGSHCYEVWYRKPGCSRWHNVNFHGSPQQCAVIDNLEAATQYEIMLHSRRPHGATEAVSIYPTTLQVGAPE